MKFHTNVIAREVNIDIDENILLFYFAEIRLKIINTHSVCVEEWSSLNNVGIFSLWTWNL